MTALVGVIATSALVGMVIAVMLSLAVILYQASRPYMARLGQLPGQADVVRRTSHATRARERCRASSSCAPTSRSPS